jgi:hypothetical protein
VLVLNGIGTALSLLSTHSSLTSKNGLNGAIALSKTPELSASTSPMPPPAAKVQRSLNSTGGCQLLKGWSDDPATPVEFRGV